MDTVHQTSGNQYDSTLISFLYLKSCLCVCSSCFAQFCKCVVCCQWTHQRRFPARVAITLSAPPTAFVLQQSLRPVQNIHTVRHAQYSQEQQQHSCCARHAGSGCCVTSNNPQWCVCVAGDVQDRIRACLPACCTNDKRSDIAALQVIRHGGTMAAVVS